MSYGTAQFDFPDLTSLVVFHHEWPSVARLVNEIRRVYPGEKILLARDDLPALIPGFMRYERIECLPERSCMQPLIDLSWNLQTPDQLDVAQRLRIVNCHVSRMREAARRSDTKYMLALEHDASVRRRVGVVPGSDLDSLDVNPYPGKVLRFVRGLGGRSFPLTGWGFVVGTFSAKSAIDVSDWVDAHGNEVAELVSVDARAVYLDFLWPLLVHLSGGQVVNTGQTIECSRSRFWRLARAPLLHQYRDDLDSDHRTLASLLGRQ